MDQAPYEEQVAENLLPPSWWVKKNAGNGNSDKQNNFSKSVRDKKIPPLKLVRPPFPVPTGTKNETTKLQHYKQNLDNALNAYTAKKSDTAIKSHLPFAPLPERKKCLYTPGVNEEAVSSLKVSLRPDPRILASLRNPSVETNTTVTITREEEQILACIKSAGLTLETVKKMIKEIEDGKSNKTVEDKTEYSATRREYLEKIREAMLRSITNRKQLLPFLYYVTLDSHDCVNSLFCISDDNEDLSQLPVNSRICIFKALKDTMTPDVLQRVRKLLREHVLDMAEGRDEPTTRSRSKAIETQTDAYHEGCSDPKKAKWSLSADFTKQMTVKNKAVSMRMQPNATATPSTHTQLVTSNLPMRNPVAGTISDAGNEFGQPTMERQMNAQKAIPSHGFSHSREATPQFWMRPAGMYAAQSPGYQQAVDYPWNPNQRRMVAFPNTNWNTSQY